MSTVLRTIVFVGLLIAALVFFSAVYQVSEIEQVVITQFGRPVGEPVTEPGLHVKAPLIQKIHRFDNRYLEWDGEANQLPTRDKRFIWVDTYARWQITEPLRFYQRLKDERGAQTRLDDILDGETRNAIANHDLLEVIRSSNREPEKDQSLPEDEAASLEPIESGREEIREEIVTASQSRTDELGIEILDVRLKRINYIESVQKDVYNRMISERKRIATRYRSEGDGEAARIRGEMQRDLQEITSKAYREAQEIQGEADAEATAIYADAYDQSAGSRSFYQLMRSLDTLEATADEETIMLLSTEGELYRYLGSSDP